MIEREIAELRRRVADDPRDGEAWIRLLALLARRDGPESIRELAHKGWAAARADPAQAQRIRELFRAVLGILGDAGLETTNPVSGAAFTGDGTRVFMPALDSQGDLLEVGSGRLLGRAPGLPIGLAGWRVADSGLRGLTVAHAGAVRLFDLAAGVETAADRRSEERCAAACDLSPDGTQVAFRPQGHGLALHRVDARGLMVRRGELPLRAAAVRFLRADPLLVSVQAAGSSLAIVDPARLAIRAEARLPGGGPLHRIALAADETALAVLAGDLDPAGTVALRVLRYDAQARMRPAGRPLPRVRPETGLALSDDARFAALAHPDRRVEVFAVDTGALECGFDDLPAVPTALAFVPGRRTLAIGQLHHLVLQGF